MRKFTKLLLTLAMLFGAVGVNSVKADNATLSQLEAAYGSTSDWTNSVPDPNSYPVNVLDALIFGSDANYQTTNANVNNYDYIYFEVTNYVSERAVRVFFWDPNQNARIDYYLKPVKDKETANYAEATTVTGNGTYCVKIPDGARLQGAKTPWIQNGASNPYFKFSEIYLTERATPYVELKPYTLVWTPNAGTYRATIPISESHIRATGGVSINYSTGEVNSTGNGSLTIYLNNENLIGATGYNLTTSNNGLLGNDLGITDAVNGEVGGIYSSRNSWHIAGDASRKEKIGAVTALKYNFNAAGSWTITSIYFDADQLIAQTTNKNLTDLPYGRWGAPANKISQYIDVDSYKTNNIGGGAEALTYGHDGIGDANKYVDLTNCSKMTLTGLSSNGQIRLFYNWDGTENGKPTETLDEFPKDASGTYVFDIDAFKKEKGISFFHLNGIKTAWGQTATISEITVDEYTNVISGSGIDRTKNYLLNPYLTSIDATGITAATELTTANPNCLITATAGKVTNSKNVIVEGVCANLELTDAKPFKAPAAFTATAAKFTKTVSDAGFATMVIPFDAAIPQGVQAFNLKGVNGETIAKSDALQSISKDQSVLIKADEGTYEFTTSNAEIAATADGVLSSYWMKGAYSTTTAAVDAGNYVLQKNGNDVNFYLVTGTPATVPPFRAYLNVPATAARTLYLDFSDATSIEAVQPNEETAEAEVYNLAGQRVDQPTKGLYIVNGKKVIVK